MRKWWPSMRPAWNPVQDQPRPRLDSSASWHILSVATAPVYTAFWTDDDEVASLDWV